VADQSDYDPAAWEALAKRDDETLKAHTAFLDYVRMGSGRSLAKLIAQYQDQGAAKVGLEKPPTKRLNTLKEWSVTHEWQKRLEAWATERNQRDQALWEERRRQLREDDWVTGERLREQANAALEQVPNFLTTKRRLIKGGEGQPDREVVTMGLRLGEVTGAAKTASDLQRAAAEAPTIMRHEVSGPGGGPIQYESGIDPERYGRALESLADALRTIVSRPGTEGSGVVDSAESPAVVSVSESGG
jgi:hypothetical protein